MWAGSGAVATHALRIPVVHGGVICGKREREQAAMHARESIGM